MYHSIFGHSIMVPSTWTPLYSSTIISSGVSSQMLFISTHFSAQSMYISVS
jgi:hypothetical protein